MATQKPTWRKLTREDIAALPLVLQLVLLLGVKKSKRLGLLSEPLTFADIYPEEVARHEAEEDVDERGREEGDESHDHPVCCT